MANNDDVLERLEQVAQGLGRGWREDLIRDLAAALREARAEIERLRADLAWAVLGRPESYARRDGSLRLVFAPEDDDGEVEVEWDGTPESIYLAVREARDGVR